MRLQWKSHSNWNYYQEQHRRFKIKQREYDPNTPNTSTPGNYRFELHEMNSPATRATGQTVILKVFDRLMNARSYAEGLVPWEKVPGTRNGWQKGSVRVICKRLSYMPKRMLDDKGRVWSIYLEGDFVSSHNNGKTAQEIAEQIFESDRAGLIDE